MYCCHARRFATQDCCDIYELPRDDQHYYLSSDDCNAQRQAARNRYNQRTDFDDMHCASDAHKLQHIGLTSRESILHHQQFNCDYFHLDATTTDYKLKSVAQCLTYLVQEPPMSESVQVSRRPLHRAVSPAFDDQRDQLSLIKRRDSFIRDRNKLNSIMNIHATVLRCLPLEAQVNDSSWIRGAMVVRGKSLDEARQQVLKLIENLNGYCDSIDRLRCILRSNHISQVILVFDKIIQKLGQQMQVNKTLTSRSLLSALDGNDVPKVEFRIVRECSV